MRQLIKLSLSYRPMALIFLMAGLLCLSFPVSSIAADLWAQLLDHPQSHGLSIVLGDLFDLQKSPEASVIVQKASLTGPTLVEASRLQILAKKAGINWENAKGLHYVVVEPGVGSPEDTGFSGESPSMARDFSMKNQKIAKNPHVDNLSGNLDATANSEDGTRKFFVCTHTIQSGQTLSEADVSLVTRKTTMSSEDWITDINHLIGKVAHHTLRAGEAVHLKDLEVTKLIHKDDMVHVRFETEGLVVTLDGKSLSEGGIGERVRILNPISKKIIEALVVDQGLARISVSETETADRDFANRRQRPGS